MNADRRRHPRQPVEKLCKVYDPVSRRYAAGCTKNVSPCGALVAVQWARPLAVGDAIDVVVDWTGKRLLPADAMIRGRIARTDASAGEVQVIAVEFDADVGLAIAA
jgi:acyl dehydratase